MSGRGEVELIVIEQDGQVLLSSRMTPGFFTVGADKNAAAARYVQILRQFGPMPMAATRAMATSAPTEPTPNPRALYLGFAFDANFGDRWMYEVLARRMPVHFGHATTLEEHWRKVAPQGHYDLAMLGGGTLINQQPQFYQDALCAHAAGLPLVCFGSGVGEVERWGDHRDVWVELLRQFAYVGVRGPHSHAALSEAGLTGHTITGDPCLLDESRLPSLTSQAPPDEPVRVWLDLSFGGQESDETLRFRHHLLALLGSLERAGVLTVNLYTSWNAYLPWIEEQTASMLGGKRPILILDPNNRAQLSTANVDLAIAYRLHAAAATLLAGIPTLVIQYEAKCLDFLAQLGLEDLVFATGAAGSARLRGRLLGDLPTFIALQRARVCDAVRAAQLEAERHFADFLGVIAAIAPRSR
ncbi:MAG TPA: polysaccharide pyruvyl transferase family protein [Polyangia bacterium]